MMDKCKKSNSQASRSETCLDIAAKFLENFKNNEKLKNDVIQKVTEVEKKLKLERKKGNDLDAALKIQKQKCNLLAKEKVEFSERIKHLENKLQQFEEKNKNLAEEKAEIADKLQQRDGKIEKLVSELNSLENQCQKLRTEKISAKNLWANRLEAMIADISREENETEGDAEHEPILRIDQATDGSLTHVHKRLHEVEVSSDQGEKPQFKRLKHISFNSNANDEVNRVPVQDMLETDSTDVQNGQSGSKQMEIDETSNVQMDGANVSNSDDTASSTKLDDIFTGFVEEDMGNVLPTNKRKNARKDIRKLIRFTDLNAGTKSALQREEERKKRYSKQLQSYNETYGTLPGEAVGSCGLVLDFDPITKKELLAVEKRLATKLKPHQAEGIKFMWDACFESLKTINESDDAGGSSGGCILAHCMGLGKTLQIVALVHTLLSNSTKTNVKRVLIICPVTVIQNWLKEFDVWLKECVQNQIKISEISTCIRANRASRINTWFDEGGVIIVGYDMFRMIYEKSSKMNVTNKNKFQENRLFEADLVVLDEGHILKNQNSKINLALNDIGTARRIILTGTPLQNNLKEYYWMVEFVKPKLLGSKDEFQNLFTNPIENGQYIDSTPDDIQLMKQQSYILYKLLDGCVQRRDYSVLAEYLPPKQEYVLFVRLTSLQIALYKGYMKNRARWSPVVDFSELRRICNHPKVLSDFSNQRKQNIQMKQKKKMATSSNGGDAEDSESDTDPTILNDSTDDNNEWWTSTCAKKELKMDASGKMVLLFAILAECEARNEKLLVFSQCLSTLNVIEHFLTITDARTKKSNPKIVGFRGHWTQGIDYFRLDGSKNIQTRKDDINNFNMENNLRARLFLISTKAGGMGINLMAANRVIIFDASWNPSNDIQSIFRACRIGQTRNCHIYQFISLGTMEEKVYDRQVTKLAIAKRVVDKQQIGRHYKENDLMELYNVDNVEPSDNDRPVLKPSEDEFFAEFLQQHKNIIFKYHEHDSLLENQADETLSQVEMDNMWTNFHKQNDSAE